MIVSAAWAGALAANRASESALTLEILMEPPARDWRMMGQKQRPTLHELTNRDYSVCFGKSRSGTSSLSQAGAGARAKPKASIDAIPSEKLMSVSGACPSTCLPEKLASDHVTRLRKGDDTLILLIVEYAVIAALGHSTPPGRLRANCYKTAM